MRPDTSRFFFMFFFFRYFKIKGYIYDRNSEIHGHVPPLQKKKGGGVSLGPNHYYTVGDIVNSQIMC